MNHCRMFYVFIDRNYFSIHMKLHILIYLHIENE